MFATVVKTFDRALAWMAGTLAALLTAAVVLGIVSRGLGEPLIWTDEVSRFLMIWLAVAGWLMAGRNRSHIRIRFFHDLLPTRLHEASEAVMQLALVLCGILLAVFGVELVRRNLDIAATTVPIAMAWVYLPMVLAGVVMTLQALADSWEAIARLRTRLQDRS
jgi:TRAP-type transport system small permease protein